MSNRACEVCRGAVPHRMHRVRLPDGRLACPSCLQRHTAGVFDYFEVVVLERGDEAPMRVHGTSDLMEAIQVARQNWDDPDFDPVHVYVMHAGNGSIFWSDGANTTDGRLTEVLGMRREAHDSGDNAIINHCPFCGSGALTARSDGAAECDFCHSTFTVQVQPQYPNAPQTVDGTPTPVPGLPGDEPTEMSAPVDPAVPADDKPAETHINPEVPVGADQAKTDAPPGKDDAKPKKNLPPWLKGKQSSVMLVTAQGIALDEESYVKHLAIRHADDPAETLAAVRAANAR